MRKTTLVLLILAAFQLTVIAQEKTEPEKEYKNTAHFNLTNPIIFGGRSIIFGYERVLSKHKTFTVNFGQTGFPTLNLIDSDSLKANTLLGQKGFHFSADYRFYLAKENKYHAPRGVYIGPYYSFNYFEKRHSWSLKSTSGGATQSVESKTSLSIHTVGFEMGYQFILWDRISLDMILAGPGVAGYNLKAAIGSNLSDADKKKFFEKLNEALADKFPGYSRVIDEGEFQNQGTAKTTSWGYRYIIQLGFRF